MRSHLQFHMVSPHGSYSGLQWSHMPHLSPHLALFEGSNLNDAFFVLFFVLHFSKCGSLFAVIVCLFSPGISDVWRCVAGPAPGIRQLAGVCHPQSHRLPCHQCRCCRRLRVGSTAHCSCGMPLWNLEETVQVVFAGWMCLLTNLSSKCICFQSATPAS